MSDGLTAFRDPAMQRALAETLASYRGRPLSIMEVCGTHTMSIMRHGIRQALSSHIRLVSGPGCPVCVTESSYIDMAIELAERSDVILATFGDLLRVPGSRGSLSSHRTTASDIRVVYSPLDVLAICTAHPDKHVIFLSVGFETTIPVIALLVRKAKAQGISNLSLLTANKTMPRALEALTADPDLRIDGFILPGHVCTITGTEFYEEFCRKHGIAGAVAGFEPTEILAAIHDIVAQCDDSRTQMDNLYTRLVRRAGNAQALAAIDEVFQPCDAIWRGIGVIPDSGLRLRDIYRDFDARVIFDLSPRTSSEPKGCLCGQILTGKHTPPDCPLFGTVCQPTSPVGACMVSSEGTCAAYYRYAG